MTLIARAKNIRGTLKEDAMKDTSATDQLLCPSALSDQKGSIVIGIVGGTIEEPRVGYLVEPQPVTHDILALTGPATPTEVLRFAAPCAGSKCKHFDGSNCRLVTRVVKFLPRVVDVLPVCRIRPKCRWWQQEGKAACVRCPQVVTDSCSDSQQLRQAAIPD